MVALRRNAPQSNLRTKVAKRMQHLIADPETGLVVAANAVGVVELLCMSGPCDRSVATESILVALDRANESGDRRAKVLGDTARDALKTIEEGVAVRWVGDGRWEQLRQKYDADTGDVPGSHTRPSQHP